MGRERPYDIVVVGASGFTGRFVVEELLTQHPSLKVAVAGRSIERTLKALRSHSVELERILRDRSLPCFEADSDRPESLRVVAEAAHVMIACAGPFNAVGLPAVEAAVAAGTHYVDITGEPLFVEECYQRFHQKAVAMRTTIVNCGGFDCVPTDLSVAEILKQIPDTKLIEGFVSSNSVGNNTGTLFSAIEGFRSAPKLRSLRATSTRPKLPKGDSRPFQPRNMYIEDRLPNRYCMLFPGADPTICRHSQIERLNQRPKPVDIALFFAFPSLVVYVAMMWVGLLITLAARFPWVENIVRRFPGLCTLGVFSASPDPASFASKFAQWDFFITTESREKRRAVWRMPDPAYGGTSRLVVACAVQLLKNKGKLCPGVVTPATAFAETDVLQMLRKRDITFQILSEDQ